MLNKYWLPRLFTAIMHLVCSWHWMRQMLLLLDWQLFRLECNLLFFQLPRIFTILNHKKNNYPQPEVISPTREHLAVSKDIFDGHDWGGEWGKASTGRGQGCSQHTIGGITAPPRKNYSAQMPTEWRLRNTVSQKIKILQIKEGFSPTCLPYNLKRTVWS